MTFEVYKITNKINGKAYVGITTQGIHKRFKQHCKADSYIGKAIRKYGSNNFDVSLIDVAIDQEELMRKEVYWVDYYDTFNNGYNLTVGGEGTSLNRRIKVVLNKKQKRFLKYVEKENKKEINVDDATFMVKTVLLNLMYTFLLSDNEKDKKNSAKMLCKLKPDLLKEVLKANVFKREDLACWGL